MTFDSVALLPHPELTSYLHQLLPAAATRLVVCGAGIDIGAPPAAPTPEFFQDMAQLQDAAPAEALLLGECAVPPTRQEAEAALRLLQPGGTLVWLI
ncbi:MAG: hypothetical protein VX290_13755, partial [Candidatus Latescibacterota bacterium]|nr:hypothetical protein [Candidatus Latescibacterota bacterium]